MSIDKQKSIIELFKNILSFIVGVSGDIIFSTEEEINRNVYDKRSEPGL